MDRNFSRVWLFLWFASGLKDNPDVSHFRLAILNFAFITFAYAMVALDLIYPERNQPVVELRKDFQIALAVLLIQLFGGFVAS